MTVCNPPLWEYSGDSLGARGHKHPYNGTLDNRAPINTPVQCPLEARLTEQLSSRVRPCLHSFHSPIGSTCPGERVLTGSSLVGAHRSPSLVRFIAGRTTTPLRNTFTSMVCRVPSPPCRLALCCVRVSLSRFMAVHYLPVRVMVSRTDHPLLHPPPWWTSCSPWHFASSPSAGAARPTTSALPSHPPCSRKCRAKAADGPPRCYKQPLPYFSVGRAPAFFPAGEQLTAGLRYSPCSLHSPSRIVVVVLGPLRYWRLLLVRPAMFLSLFPHPTSCLLMIFVYVWIC
jgi:hypothetical protein